MGGKSSSAPKPPDPYKTAAAQYKYSTLAAQDAARMNNINQTTPYGSITWTRDANGVPISQNVSLSPSQQQAFDSQSNLNAALSGKAASLAGQVPDSPFHLPSDLPDYITGLDYSQLGELPSADDFSSDRDALTNAVYQRGFNLMNPQFQQDKRAQAQRLSDQGIDPFGEAATTADSNLARNQNDALTNLGLGAVSQGAAEQQRLFEQALQGYNARLGTQTTNAGLAGNARNAMTNEALMEYNAPAQQIATLLGTTPKLQSQQALGYSGANIAAPNLEGDIWNNYNAQLQKYQADQAAQNAIWGDIGSLAGSVGSAAIFASDENIKEDFAPADAILDRVEEIPISSWKYKADSGHDDGLSHVGPMAQDFRGFFGLGDGKSIPMVDAAGINLAATQQLARKVRNLERRAA